MAAQEKALGAEHPKTTECTMQVGAVLRIATMFDEAIVSIIRCLLPSIGSIRVPSSRDLVNVTARSG